MQLALTICLPPDSLSIPVSRHIVRDALRAVGATDECVAAIAIAMSEACTNVVEHSRPGDQYEVRVRIDAEKCIISVIDTGQGFDARSISAGDTSADSERGRGILLMRALVDQVDFVTGDEAGTVVSFEKALEFEDRSVMKRARGSR